MPAASQNTLEDSWRPAFRHSVGRLGSQYIRSIREEHTLLGWKTPQALTCPPKDLGQDGAWIRVGPGADLLNVLPAQWQAVLADHPFEGFRLGRVLIDGATTPQFALIRTGDGSPLGPGARLSVAFPDSTAEPASLPDYWFEHAGSETGAGRT